MILRLAAPAVGEGLFQVLFNLTDIFWVGRTLGSAALAGISTAGFAVWMMIAVAEVAAVGLTAVESRRLGEGRPDAAAAAVYQAFALSLVLAVALGAAGLLLLSPLFELMATPTEVTVFGAGYLAVWLTGTPIVFAYFVMTAAFRAAGDTRVPLYLLAGSVLLNVGLDPLLILGWGPVPRLGIEGAALATLLSRGAGCAVGLLVLPRRGLVRRAVPRARGMLRIARIGLPVAIGGTVFAAVYMVLTRIASPFGTPALAALGVGHRVESLSFMVCVGFGLASATAVGQNLGAGLPERAVASGRQATVYALAVTAIVGTVFLVVPEWVMLLFTGDPEVVAAGTSYLRIVALAQLGMALHLVLEISMEGAGYTVLPMVASVCLTLLRLPLAAALSGVIGLAGIWWAISSTAMARGVVAWWIWRAGHWRRRAV